MRLLLVLSAVSLVAGIASDRPVDQSLAGESRSVVPCYIVHLGDVAGYEPTVTVCPPVT